jgi:arylsulfatase A-like enzyme
VLRGYASPTRTTTHDPAWVAHLARLGYEIPARFWDLYAQQEGYPGAEGRGSTFAPGRIPAEHSETAFLTDSVLAHLRSWRPPAPDASPGWFVHASYLRPHPPFVAPEGYHDRYDPADVAPPVRHDDIESEMAQHPFLASSLRLGIVRAPDSDVELRQTAATYYGLMSQVDDELGRLFDGLRASGQWDDTLVVVTADHGEQMGDHWMMGKLGWFEQSYRIPLLVRDPRGEADGTRGTVVHEFTENVDLMPTVLDWLGLEELPVQCDGRTLLPFLTEGTAPPEWRTEAHWEFDFRNPWHPAQLARLGLRMEHSVLGVVRSRTHKYVHFPTLPPVLYDLGDDPHELSDRAGDPALAATRLDLVERMLSWRMVNDERTLTGTQVGTLGVRVANDRLR